MKTKEKEIQKKIKELCELMDEDEKFFFFRKKGNNVVIALPSASKRNDDMVSAALSSVIESYFLDKGDEGVDRFSEIIVDSIEALIAVSPLASAKLSARFAKAALLGMKMTLDRTKDFDEDDDDENGVEDCENCEFLKTCDNDAAIKYRKEHGIPKPKKGKGHKVNVK